jgi:uncharacterized phage infection (PIP) family protein YhgE
MHVVMAHISASKSSSTYSLSSEDRPQISELCAQLTDINHIVNTVKTRFEHYESSSVRAWRKLHIGFRNAFFAREKQGKQLDNVEKSAKDATAELANVRTHLTKLQKTVEDKSKSNDDKQDVHTQHTKSHGVILDRHYTEIKELKALVQKNYTLTLEIRIDQKRSRFHSL